MTSVLPPDLTVRSYRSVSWWTRTAWMVLTSVLPVFVSTEMTLSPGLRSAIGTVFPLASRTGVSAVKDSPPHEGSRLDPLGSLAVGVSGLPASVTGSSMRALSSPLAAWALLLAWPLASPGAGAVPLMTVLPGPGSVCSTMSSLGLMGSLRSAAGVVGSAVMYGSLVIADGISPGGTASPVAYAFCGGGGGGGAGGW